MEPHTPVGRVSSFEPHSVEAQRDEAPDDRAERPRRQQEKLQKGIRVLLLQNTMAAHSELAHHAMFWASCVDSSDQLLFCIPLITFL